MSLLDKISTIKNILPMISKAIDVLIKCLDVILGAETK